MSYLKKITSSNFFIRLRSWEYWPFGIVQFPAMVYWLWLSMRSRSLVFFSASNPGIPMGGMFGESKYDILKDICDQYKARTILIRCPASAEGVSGSIADAGLTFPLIFKPDIGERGFMVKKISASDEIGGYLAKVKTDFLVQELIQLPREFGVFYRRFPWEGQGKVISIVAKEMLSVTGDGRKTLKVLIFENPRSKLQWKNLKSLYHDRLDFILPDGERIELVSIGNHCLGTTFLDASHLINDRISMTFDGISRQIPGFYFGRFDLRCKSVEDLYEGKVKIMELNGCGAEPVHVYDPGFSLWKAMFVRVIHWDNIFRIARANKKQGAKYVSHREAYSFYRKFKRAVK